MSPSTPWNFIESTEFIEVIGPCRLAHGSGLAGVLAGVVGCGGAANLAGVVAIDLATNTANDVANKE